MKVSTPQRKRGNKAAPRQFKKLLEEKSPDFAWEVMELEIRVEDSCQLDMSQIMKLIQLYMLAVEVLEDNNDNRFRYFNSKIYSLMTKKQVIEQLHQATTGHSPDPDNLEQLQQQELQNKKSILELQLSLQKEAFTLSSVKDILQKNESLYNHREKKIQEELVSQNQVLQGRIRNRRLKSVSKGKPIPPKSHQEYGTKTAYKLRERSGERRKNDQD